VQYAWLEAQLADAQRTTAFSFVVCHQCPYSYGAHGGEIGEPDNPEKKDTQTGRALRLLEPLFHKYGVDGWLCGHDEMMERSTVEGFEELPSGEKVAHTLQVWDMGIAGDGLRGGVVNENPNEAYRAGKDAVEQFDANGTLTGGGRHYGHMEVEVAQGGDGKWRATFSPVYVFVTTNAQGQACGFERRTYDDVQTLVSTAVEPAWDTPPEVTLGTPVATAGTDFAGSTVVVGYTLGEGGMRGYAELSATLTVGGQAYAGVVDAAGGTMTFTLGPDAAAAGQVYAGRVRVVAVNAAGAMAPVAERDVRLVQGLYARDVRSGWVDETAAQVGKTGTWTPANPAVAAGRMVFDEDAADDGYVFAPSDAEPTNTVTRIESDLCFERADADLTVPGDAQAGVKLAAVKEGEATVVRWAFLDADGWQVKDVPGVTPDPSQTYRVKVELDYTRSPARVTYRLATAGGDVSAHVGNLRGEMTHLAYLSVVGSGEAEAITGAYEYDGVDARVAEAGGEKFARVADAQAADRGPVTLLWRASFAPQGDGGVLAVTNPDLLVADWQGYEVTSSTEGGVTTYAYVRSDRQGTIFSVR